MLFKIINSISNYIICKLKHLTLREKAVMAFDVRNQNELLVR